MRNRFSFRVRFRNQSARLVLAHGAPRKDAVAATHIQHPLARLNAQQSFARRTDQRLVKAITFVAMPRVPMFGFGISHGARLRY